MLESRRIARAECRRLGEELCAARARLGLTQADVGRAVGVSRSTVSALEGGDPGVSLQIRFRVGLLLGLRLRLPAYADQTPLLHDAAHARIVERLVRMANQRWRITLESPVPGPGTRSSDLRLEAGPDVVLFEVESHVLRWEEIVRETQSKRETVRAALPSRRVHSVLVLPPTRHHRDLVAALRSSVRSVFPHPSSTLEACLAGADGAWPGDGLLWVPGAVTRSR
jgi:DNA-binding XRE family transcriptional regulator